MTNLCIWATINSVKLSAQIAELANSYNGPIFHPHCTILGRTNASLKALKTIVKKISDSLTTKYVTPKRIAYSDNIWRSLYIEINEKEIFTTYYNLANMLISREPHKDYLPHISLMYIPLSIEKKN